MGDTLSQICQSVKCTTVDLTRLRWYEDLDVSVCEGKTTEIVSLPTHTHTFFWHHWSIEVSKTKPHKANWTFFHIFYFTLNFLTLRELCGNLPTTHSFHPKWRLFGRNVTQLADTQKTYNLRGESSFINKERLLRESRWIKYTWRNSLCSSNKKWTSCSDTLRCFYAWNTELSRKRLRFSDNHKYEFIFCEKVKQSVSDGRSSLKQGRRRLVAKWAGLFRAGRFLTHKEETEHWTHSQKLQVWINSISLSESPFFCF